MSSKMVGGERPALLGEYLRTRRELLQPEAVGLARERGRRVNGLRRSEVAARAGISYQYYLRLEQGRDTQPSDQVLRALREALKLEAESVAYMERLIRLQEGVGRVTAPAISVAQGVAQMLDRWEGTPAYVCDHNFDIAASNELARRLGDGALDPGENVVLHLFAQSRTVHDQAADRREEELVGALRFRSEPFDPRLREIVGTLSIRSERFRKLWAMHSARPAHSGNVTHILEPQGVLNLRYQDFEIPGAPGWTLTALHGEPGSAAAIAVAALAGRSLSWGRQTAKPALAS
jgi:transcriptional regulator with XRE-family HTH domain